MASTTFGAFLPATLQNILKFTGSQFSTGALVGATIPAANMAGATSVWYTNTSNTPGTLTTDTALNIIAQIQNNLGAVVAPGTSYDLQISHTGTGTLTLAAGTGVTINGTNTIATVTSRSFTVTVNSPTAVTLQNVASGTN